MDKKAFVLKNFVIAQLATLLTTGYLCFFTDFNILRYGALAQLFMLPAYGWICYFYFRKKKGFEIALFIGFILLVLSLFGLFSNGLSPQLLGTLYLALSHLAYARLSPESLLKHLNKRV